MRAIVVERPNLVHLREFDLPEKRAYVLAWVVAACAAVGFALAPGLGFRAGDRLVQRHRYRFGANQGAHLRVAGRHGRVRRKEKRRAR
jgi:hypothetical protein